MLGFHVSLSGIRVGLTKLDVSANNLANATTPGFKASFARAVDDAGGGAHIGSVRVDFTSGPLESPEGSFSLAVEGEGFFRVGTPQGERFTRAGAFRVDGEGRVVTAEGHPLLPEVRIPPAARAVSVAKDGTVRALQPDGSTVELGRISLSRFTNPSGLTAVGGGLWSAGPASGAARTGTPGSGSFGGLVFGALEGSNVDLASEMVSQITSSATVKANLAALKAKKETLGTVIDLVS